MGRWSGVKCRLTSRLIGRSIGFVPASMKVLVVSGVGDYCSLFFQTTKCASEDRLLLNFFLPVDHWLMFICYNVFIRRSFGEGEVSGR